MITILGASGMIQDVESFIHQLSMFSSKERLVAQAFDARLIYGKEHILSAVTHAKRSFQQGTNATNTLALEILLYAAGERQIQKAIKKMGVKKGKQGIVFLLTDVSAQKNRKGSDEAVVQRLLKTFQFTRDDSVINGDRETLKRFGVTKNEVSTVSKDRYGDLILEKIALVDIIK
jgi:KEOPS complex subunit Cgi121